MLGTDRRSGDVYPGEGRHNYEIVCEVVAPSACAGVVAALACCPLCCRRAVSGQVFDPSAASTCEALDLAGASGPCPLEVAVVDSSPLHIDASGAVVPLHLVPAMSD